MPLELAKISALRPGWLMVMGLLALSVLRKWLLSKVVERPVRNSGPPARVLERVRREHLRAKDGSRHPSPAVKKVMGKLGARGPALVFVIQR